MNDIGRKEYIFASDFDQTLTFNDSGYVLAELVGIPTDEFERKATGMARLNLVQQGGELAYLLLHDPEFKLRVRKEHLYEVGKRIRLKENIALLYQILDSGIPGYHFDFYVLSAAPVEIVQSALEGIVPEDHIFGTDFLYKESGEIDTITRATAGYGKVFVLDQLQSRAQIGPDQVAKRTVLSTSALAVLAPIFEDIAGWDRLRIREFFESYGVMIQEWDRVRTDWLTLRAVSVMESETAAGK